MGAQTVRTVTPLSKCRATWCFFPAQTPATREKPPNSRSNPYVSQYACLPWAGKRDKGSVGQNKEPTKETRNRLNFSWGNIGRKPKFFIRRKHCIGPRHSSKKAILPQRFVSSPWRERSTKIQETSNHGLTVPLELEVLNDEHCTFPAVYVLSSRPVTSVM